LQVKNKAVVNEDTTGSINQLQAEISTLRRQLADCKGMS
jgi:hypothetical protein